MPWFPDFIGAVELVRRQTRTDAIVNTFAPDGYHREPIGPHASHRGTAELRSFFTRRFSAGGGIACSTAP